MELRPLGGQHWYSPNRDFVPVLIQMCRETCYKMTQDVLDSNHATQNLVKAAEVKVEHMAKAAEALGNFIRIASEDASCTSLVDALDNSGILALPQPVVTVMFSLLAQSCLGRFWGCVRNSALPEAIAPIRSKEALLNSSELMHDIFSKKTNMDLANALKDMQRWANAPLR
jgi:hypothetical protein